MHPKQGSLQDSEDQLTEITNQHHSSNACAAGLWPDWQREDAHDVWRQSSYEACLETEGPLIALQLLDVSVSFGLQEQGP